MHNGLRTSILYRIKLTEKSFISFWFLFLVSYLLIDFVRIFLNNSKITLFLLDAIIMINLGYFLYYRKMVLYGLKQLPKTISVCLLLIALIIVIQFVNPYFPDLITYVGGARAYLFPVITILLGIEFARSGLLMEKKVVRFVLSITVIAVSFSVYQIVADVSKISGIAFSLLTAQETNIHSHGTEEVRLVSSFFASSKRYGRFLLVMYLLYSSITFNQGKQLKVVHVAIFFIGLVISGARESVVLFVLINFVYFWKFIKFQTFLRTMLVLLVLVIGFSVFSLGKNALTRAEFLVSSPEKYKERISHFFPIVSINTENDYLLTGLGVGKYGQEARLNPLVKAKTLGSEYEFFTKPSYSTNFQVVSDPGLSKIFIELGLFGLAVFLVFLVRISMMGVKEVFRKDQWDYTRLSLALFILIWVVLFLKSHPVISDVFLSFFLYFSIGYLTMGRETSSIDQSEFQKN